MNSAPNMAGLKAYRNHNKVGYMSPSKQLREAKQVMMNIVEHSDDEKAKAMAARVLVDLDRQLMRRDQIPDGAKAIEAPQEENRRAHTLALASDEADPSPVILPKVG